MTRDGRDQAIDPVEWHTVTAAETLEPWHRHVMVVINDEAADNYSVTLPLVSDEQCIDKLFTIRGVELTGHNDGAVTIQDQDDTILATDYTSSVTIDAAKDYVCLMNCGGVLWVEIAVEGT